MTESSLVSQLYVWCAVCSSCLVVSDCFMTPWTVACQAPLSIEFSRQEQWSGLPFPPPGDLPDPEIEPESPMSPLLADRFFTTEAPGSPISVTYSSVCKFFVLKRFLKVHFHSIYRELLCNELNHFF